MRPALRHHARSALVLALLLARAAGAETGAARLVGPFAKADYPQALIDRPLTLPAGMVEGEIGGRFVSRRFPVSILGVGGTDEWLADVAIRVGVTDRFQIEAATAFSLDYTMRHFEGFLGAQRLDARPNLTSWQRVVPLRLSLLALDTETLDTALTLTLPFVAHASRTFVISNRFGTTVTTTNGDGRVLPVVQLAAPTRWRLNDWLWLRAGEDLFSVTTGEGQARFAFDLGVGVQPHRLFAVTLDSRIASIAFDGDGHESSQTLADVGTIDREGVFAPCSRFDVVGSLGMPDTGRGFDDYVIRLAVRLRI